MSEFIYPHVSADAASSGRDATVASLPRGGALPPAAMWPLSGSYVGVGDDYRVEIMLDIDTLRSHALLTVDFYALDGAVGTHIGAGLLRSSTIVNHSDHSLIRGVGRFTFAAAAPLIEAHIERRHTAQRRAPLNLRFLSMTLVPGALYSCEYRSQLYLAGAGDSNSLATVLPFDRALAGKIA